MCRAQGDSGHSFVVPSDTFWKLSPSFQQLSYSASPSACLDTLKLLCVWTGETELLFRSYLQGSDIRQLFPRKLTLHIKRERGKKKKKKENEGCVFKTEGPGGRRRREQESCPKKSKFQPVLPSLESSSFFLTRLWKMRETNIFLHGKSPYRRARRGFLCRKFGGVEEQTHIFPKTHTARQSYCCCPSQHSWERALQMLPETRGNEADTILWVSPDLRAAGQSWEHLQEQWTSPVLPAGPGHAEHKPHRTGQIHPSAQKFHREPRATFPPHFEQPPGALPRL